MIEFDIKVDYADFEAQFAAQLPMQGCTAIFGASGQGKTTLLRALAGLDRHTNSTVRFDQTDWQSRSTWTPPERRRIGYCAQQPCLFEHLDVRGNLEFARARAANPSPFDFDELVTRFDCGHLLAKRVQAMSGGERQRVALVRLFLSVPRLVLLDEAFSALDRDAKRDLLQHTKQLCVDHTIPMVLVTHSIDEISLVSDHLVLLQDHQVLTQGPTDALFTRLDLPLAHHPQARALLEAKVVAIDADYHLMVLENAAGQFSVLHQGEALGETIRFGIAARDVSLSHDEHASSSILNRLQCRVVDVVDSELGQCLVRLEKQGIQFLARITRKSVDTLNVNQGDGVMLQIKSVALF